MPKHTNQLHNQNEEKEKRAAELSTMVQDLKRNEEHLQTEVTKHKRAAEALRLSEQKFFILFEKSAFTSSLSRLPDGVITNVNEAFERAFGYTKQEVIGKTSLELGINPDEEGRARILATLKEYGSARNQELALHTKSGEMRIFSVNVDLMDIGDQKYILNTTQDITERKQAEDELRQNKERFEAIIEAAEVGIWDWNVQTGEAVFNERWAKIVGYSLEEIAPISIQTWMDLAHPDDLKQSDAMLEKHFNGETKIYEFESRMKHKDGQWVYVLDRGKVLTRTADGKPLRMLGTHIDITERKKMEREISEAKHFLELVIGNSPLPIITHDAQGNVSQWNPATEKLLGWTAQEVIGKPLPIIPAERQGQFNENISEVFKGNSLTLEDAPILCKNGSVISCEIAVGLLRGAQAETKGMVAILNDITERKQANLKLEEQNQELAFQNEEKEKRAAELVLANKELAFQNEEKEKRAAELVLANKDIARRLQNIHALNKIDQAIVGSLDLNLTLHVVLEQTKSELNVDAAAVLLFNRYSKILEFAAGIGFRSKTIERSRLRLGEGLGGRAALEGRSISVTNLLNAKPRTQFVRTPLLADEGFVTYSSTPLVVKGQVKGILEVFHRSPFTPDQNWLDFLEVLAGQTAIAVDSANLFTDLQYSNAELFNAYDSTIEGWSRALDLRDKETEGHTQRVTELTLKLARAAGISEKELIHMRRGALLHDIGKMGVPDSILLKPDKLTDEEWVIMRKHPTFAFELITPIAYLRRALDIPYCHHEKWDGSGYPRRLKGEQIPLAARLFSIIDVWDALRSDRPYRQGWSKERVKEHIKSLSGTHFEAKAVELFLNMINEDDEDSL